MKILFEENGIVVRENGSGEIFITSPNKMVTVRVSPNHDNITVTAAGNKISPYKVNGLAAIIIN